MMQKARIRLVSRQIRPIGIKRLDLVAVRAYAEHRCMFMNAQRAERILRRVRGGNRVIEPEVPEADFAVATARDEFAEAAALHVHVGDPLFVVAPDFDHCSCGF